VRDVRFLEAAVDRALKHHIAQLGRDCLEGRLHRDAFLDAVNTTAIPDLHNDEDVSELLDLISHGPALTLGWGRWIRVVQALAAYSTRYACQRQRVTRVSKPPRVESVDDG
jgi:hypothetical protein